MLTQINDKSLIRKAAVSVETKCGQHHARTVLFGVHHHSDCDTDWSAVSSYQA